MSVCVFVCLFVWFALVVEIGKYNMFCVMCGCRMYESESERCRK